MTDEFRKQLQQRRCYRAEDHHGKHALVHVIDLNIKLFLALDDSDVELLLWKPSSFDFLRERQIEFLVDQLLPLLRRFYTAGKDVFVLLSNDDFVELEEV